MLAFLSLFSWCTGFLPVTANGCQVVLFLGLTEPFDSQSLIVLLSVKFSLLSGPYARWIHLMVGMCVNPHSVVKLWNSFETKYLALTVYSLSSITRTAKITLKCSMQFALVTVFIVMMNGILLYWSATSKNCGQLNSKISAAMFWNGQVACSLRCIVSLEFFLWCSPHISHVLIMFSVSLLIPL